MGRPPSLDGGDVAVNPSLMWENGPAIQGDGHRLVITREQEHQLRPLVAHQCRGGTDDERRGFAGAGLPSHSSLRSTSCKDVVTQTFPNGRSWQWKILANVSDHQVHLTFWAPNCPRTDRSLVEAESASVLLRRLDVDRSRTRHRGCERGSSRRQCFKE